MKLMTAVWTRWKEGWVVFLKVAWFSFLLWILLSPIKLVGFALGAQEQAVFDNAGFHLKSGVAFFLVLMWLPLACWLTSSITGWLGPSKAKTTEASRVSEAT